MKCFLLVSNFRLIQPMTGTEGELPKYKYKYAVPVTILNSLPNTGKIGGKKMTAQTKMIAIHDWQEMDNVQELRQGDTYTHVWETSHY